MNLKGTLVLLAVIGLGLLSSCKGGYTCPTYMKNTDNSETIMVKKAPTTVNTEIKS